MSRTTRQAETFRAIRCCALFFIAEITRREAGECRYKPPVLHKYAHAKGDGNDRICDYFDASETSSRFEEWLLYENASTMKYSSTAATNFQIERLFDKCEQLFPEDRKTG